MIKVYAWPPVGVVGSEWTEEAPVQRSRSMLTGKDYMSAYARKRRVATLVVSSLAKTRSGAGYSEVLKRLLDGGINAVRLNSYPINWWQEAQVLDEYRRLTEFDWTYNGDVISWTASDVPFKWYTGVRIEGGVTKEGDYWVVSASGFPPNKLIAHAGDFITLYDYLDNYEVGQAQILRDAISDSTGAAVIYTLDELPILRECRFDVGTSSTGIFRAIEMPRAIQPLSGDWNYTWKFREVFADEVGGFEEVDPWT